MSTRDYILSLWKTFVITATGLVAVWLANHGIHLSDAQSAAVTIALSAAGLAAYNTAVNHLLTRTGTGVPSKLALALGKVLALGGSAPKYADASTSSARP